ncbi:paramyosin-like [Echeneis naucrates]|uniref:paramyosin-like n=1 Tax=Echeneis naucrates TaxID=173247 RepID=UPI00111404C5|nr:paramyosin-like [Echeneis naucrates]
MGTVGDVPLELPVLWDELRGLKDLVLILKAEEVQRRQALRSMESRVRDGELEAKQQRQTLDGLQDLRTLLMDLDSDLRRRVEELEDHSKALQAGLNASERSVEDLKKKNTALAAELPFLQTRLRASESKVEQLRSKNTGHLHPPPCFLLCVTDECCVTLLSLLVSVLASRLCHTETLVEDLRIQISGSNTSSPSDSRLQVLNTNSEAQLSVLESRLSQINRTTTALEVRLRSSEKHLEHLQMGNTAHGAELSAVALRLNHTEGRLDELTNQNTALEQRLRDSNAVMMELQDQNSAQLSVLESRLSQINRTTTALEVRLRSSEKHLEHLQMGNTAHGAELSAVALRLNHTEGRLDELTNQNTALEQRLRDSNAVMMELQDQNSELEVRLSVGEEQLEHLQSENSDEMKVAFSAGLTDSGSIGPFDQETTLVFSKTISNVGGAYQQTSGVFTAPFRGVYFFCFTAADYLKGYMGLYLYRNDQPIIFNLDLNDHGGYASTSNGVALQLEEGDRVHLSLPASYRLYDDSRNFSVFSGFLLFPL